MYIGGWGPREGGLHDALLALVAEKGLRAGAALGAWLYITTIIMIINISSNMVVSCIIVSLLIIWLVVAVVVVVEVVYVLVVVVVVVVVLSLVAVVVVVVVVVVVLLYCYCYCLFLVVAGLRVPARDHPGLPRRVATAARSRATWIKQNN